MADESHGPPAPLGVNVDYKTLFMGSCTLIVVLGGGLYGLWTRGAEQAAEDNRTTNSKQWQRLAELETRVAAYEYKVTRLQQDVEVNTKLIRDLERSLMMLERRK